MPRDSNRRPFGGRPRGGPRRQGSGGGGGAVAPRGAGGTVAPTPIVITVGINGVGITYANVVGSINPQGASGTVWWVSYGTSSLLPSGTTSLPTSLGSSSTTTVTCHLSGLTTGQTYYAAMVAQNGGGTVYGQTLSFVAQAPVTPRGQPTVPYGQPAVTIPHFDVPFSLVTSGVNSGAIVVEQDTLEEIFACVNTVVECTVGQCPTLPFFGRPDLTFSQGPVDTRGIVTAIQQLEPRANEDAVSQLLADGSTWGVSLTTSSAGTEGL